MICVCGYGGSESLCQIAEASKREVKRVEKNSPSQLRIMLLYIVFIGATLQIEYELKLWK